jgi:DNA polymerase-1
MEWFLVKFGWEIMRQGVWHCTQAQAYILDCRSQNQSLDALCLQHFGMHLKKFSNIDVANLDAVPVEKVLNYNILDSVFGRMLYEAQKIKLKSANLMDVYYEQVNRIPTIVYAQYKGFTVDQNEVKKYRDVLIDKQAQCEQELMNFSEIVQYEAQFGEFSPNSPKQCVALFRDIIGRNEGKRGDKYSVDEEALTEMNIPIADKLLEYRKLGKLRSTYVDRLDINNDNPYTYDDGKIHFNFTTTFTATRRLSAEDPNVQNYPRRKNKEIRRVFCPGKGKVILKADYGQLEYRVMGMLAKDKTIIDSLYNDYDVHSAWAERINQVYPNTCKSRYGGFDKAAMKKWRDDIKQYLVFAAFYGSMESSISKILEIPSNKFRGLFEEFWQMFSGVKSWQLDNVEYYKKHSRIVTPTGFVRYGPLSDNMIFNTPVQSTGSDIVVDAMNRLNEMAIEMGDPNLSANLNVHDDLTFELPEKDLDYYQPIIVKEMLFKSFDFINVPLCVEVSVGPNWCDCEEVGKFYSNKLPEGWK